MTKIQLKNAVFAELETNKANAKLTAAITAIMEEYTLRANGDTVKREKTIEKDGNMYVWCNRHEVYEPQTNFKRAKTPSGFADECTLALLVHRELSKEIKTLNDSLMAKAIEGEDIQEIAVELKEKKEIRAGRYSWEANDLQYPDIEGYISDITKFIQPTE